MLSLPPPVDEGIATGGAFGGGIGGGGETTTTGTSMDVDVDVVLVVFVAELAAEEDAIKLECVDEGMDVVSEAEWVVYLISSDVRMFAWTACVAAGEESTVASVAKVVGERIGD